MTLLRRCLKCNKEFHPESRGFFCCPLCRKQNFKAVIPNITSKPHKVSRTDVYHKD